MQDRPVIIIGVVTTGPVTVPLVLALGIGVCRIVSTGGSSNTGFGVVTLASLFPILAVICYALYLFKTDNYYFASESKAEWHVNAGEYGKNYPKDLQKFGDLKVMLPDNKQIVLSAGPLTFKLKQELKNFSDDDLKEFLNLFVKATDKVKKERNNA